MITSSSAIVMVTGVLAPATAPEGALSVTVNASSDSPNASSTMGMLTVLLVSFAAKEMVLETVV